MSRIRHELSAYLQDADLEMAAFDLAKQLEGGVYPKEMVEALRLFTRVPCSETAIILLKTCPEAAVVMSTRRRPFASLPKNMRGPHYDGLDQWTQSFQQNLRVSDAVHEFLLRGALTYTISIGFHRMRDQSILFDRLALIGIRKSFFSKRRQFIRNKITRNRSAFRAVLDLVCIHGIDGTRERFWDALGAQVDAQWHLRSEIQYDVSGHAARFAELIDNLTRSSGDGGVGERF